MSFLLGDFERRLFYHNLYGVVSLPALHFARRYARTKSGRRSLPKAVPLCRFLKKGGARMDTLDELLPREKCSDPALLPSATWNCWRFFYVPARREKML
ncbi:hypothetical protein BB105_05085 [Salmonella enterica subsp. enterica serovar Panama]|nr:hypothetical protein [Salmonella enterica]EBS4387541.1 hypothetical protein [Salmonella enterica subsp. enterica serovar Panama]EAN0332024.1 hypothetical protein [Salmonella enterica]EAO7826471.1 hypothetical protein [Salmonella enterica]EAO8074568.1 hypothetical protein [Salmonella enterica]